MDTVVGNEVQRVTDGLQVADSPGYVVADHKLLDHYRAGSRAVAAPKLRNLAAGKIRGAEKQCVARAGEVLRPHIRRQELVSNQFGARGRSVTFPQFRPVPAPCGEEGRPVHVGEVERAGVGTRQVDIFDQCCAGGGAVATEEFVSMDALLSGEQNRVAEA